MGSGKYGTSMYLTRRNKKRMAQRLTKQEKRWARRSGEVKVRRLDDLPADHPARPEAANRLPSVATVRPEEASSTKEGKA